MKEKLLSLLADRGWSVTRHSAELEWWAQEIWVLESKWAPPGYTLFLTFLVDPRPGGTDPFWAVGTCPHWPEDRYAAGQDPSICFRGWVEALPGFIRDLDQLREEFKQGLPRGS
jgi:hypothetical protein